MDWASGPPSICFWVDPGLATIRPVPEEDLEHRCLDCKQMKSAGEFGRRTGGDFVAYCRERSNARTRADYAKNRDYRWAQMYNYMARGPTGSLRPTVTLWRSRKVAAVPSVRSAWKLGAEARSARWLTTTTSAAGSEV